MSQVLATAAQFKGLQGTQSRSGQWLGLIAGLCIAWFILTPSIILRVDLPQTTYSDLPIRLMTIGMLVWRRSRTQLRAFWWFDAWLAVLVLLPFASTLYASVMLERNIGQKDILVTLSPFITPVCIYLVVSEVRLRPQFRSTWAVAPLIALLLGSCFLGILQSRDWLHARSITETVFHYKQMILSMYGPSAQDQARGIFNHANAFALSMSVLVALTVPFLRHRKWVFFICLIFAAIGVVASQSRNGVITFAFLVGTMPWLLLLQNRRQQALRFGGMAFAIGLVGLVLLVSFGSARFRAIADKNASKSTELSKQKESLNYRGERLKLAMKVTANTPLLGVGPAGRMYSPRQIVENPLSLRGVLNSQYGLSTFQFGVVGLISFVGLIIGLILSVRNNTLSYERISLGCFGLIALVGGVGENVLLQREFLGPLCLVAGILVPRYNQTKPFETVQAIGDEE
jgi:O-antigen ligase